MGLWSTLNTMSPYCKAFLQQTNSFVGIPSSLKNPIPVLSGPINLEMRTALAFAAVGFGTLFEASAVLATAYCFTKGTWKFVTCRPIDAFYSYAAGIGIGVTGVAVAYLAKKYI